MARQLWPVQAASHETPLRVAQGEANESDWSTNRARFTTAVDVAGS